MLKFLDLRYLTFSNEQQSFNVLTIWFLFCKNSSAFLLPPPLPFQINPLEISERMPPSLKSSESLPNKTELSAFSLCSFFPSDTIKAFAVSCVTAYLFISQATGLQWIVRGSYGCVIQPEFRTKTWNSQTAALMIHRPCRRWDQTISQGGVGGSLAVKPNFQECGFVLCVMEISEISFWLCEWRRGMKSRARQQWIEKMLKGGSTLREPGSSDLDGEDFGHWVKRSRPLASIWLGKRECGQIVWKHFTLENQDFGGGIRTNLQSLKFFSKKGLTLW